MGQKYSAKEIAAMIQGQISGDPDKNISIFSKIEEAESESICFFANEKYSEYLANTKAGILLVGLDFRHSVPKSTTLIHCQNPYEAAAKLLEFYEKKIKSSGIEVGAHIHSSAKIGVEVYIANMVYISENVDIGDGSKVFPHSFIGKDVKIGKNVVIHAGVKVYDECVIGDHCIIHSGVVIGSDGFGFAPTADGSYSKIPQIGNVILENHVEVGANTVIDRATMGSTTIRSGTKLDNLIQIAHNVIIGKNTVIAAQTGISGSTKIGDQVMIGGQVGIVGHIQIGDKSRINAQSGVSKNLDPNSTVTGSPAWEYTPMLKAQAVFKRLPDILERLIRLEKKIGD